MLAKPAAAECFLKNTCIYQKLFRTLHEQKHNLNPNKMKRILLILTILAISLTTVGQTPSYRTAVIPANPTTLQGGIVRSWTANSAVAHFHENDIHYFAVISESSYNMSAVKFSDNYFQNQ